MKKHLFTIAVISISFNISGQVCLLPSISSPFAVGPSPVSITSADFNTDGIADLAVANSFSNNVSVLIGSGAGNFSSSVNFAVGSNPASLISVDFNTDGNTDLAVAHSYQHNN